MDTHKMTTTADRIRNLGNTIWPSCSIGAVTLQLAVDFDRIVAELEHATGKPIEEIKTMLQQEMIAGVSLYEAQDIVRRRIK